MKHKLGSIVIYDDYCETLGYISELFDEVIEVTTFHSLEQHLYSAGFFDLYCKVISE